MQLKEIQGEFSILRYDKEVQIPTWTENSCFFCIVRTDEELSILCETNVVLDTVKNREDGWKCIKIQGLLDFALTGILSSITAPLANADISIFAVSTFDTDYFLVKKEQLTKAKEVLRDANFSID